MQVSPNPARARIPSRVSRRICGYIRRTCAQVMSSARAIASHMKLDMDSEIKSSLALLIVDAVGQEQRRGMGQKLAYAAILTESSKLGL